LREHLGKREHRPGHERRLDGFISGLCGYQSTREFTEARPSHRRALLPRLDRHRRSTIHGFDVCHYFLCKPSLYIGLKTPQKAGSLDLISIIRQTHRRDLKICNFRYLHHAQWSNLNLFLKNGLVDTCFTIMSEQQVGRNLIKYWPEKAVILAKLPHYSGHPINNK